MREGQVPNPARDTERPCRVGGKRGRACGTGCPAYGSSCGPGACVAGVTRPGRPGPRALPPRPRLRGPAPEPWSEAPGGDVAVGGPDLDAQAGRAVGVPERVVDPAVAGAGVQGGGHSAGRVDGDVSGAGAQGEGAADRLGDADAALLGADLTRAPQAADRDVAGLEGEADARGLVQLDRARRALEGDVAESPDAPELGGGRSRVDVGAGGQVDGHLDGAGVPEDPVGRFLDLDPQDTVRVGHLGGLRRLHVAALRSIRRPYLDRGVGPVGGDEPDESRRDAGDGGDRGGGVEVLHRALLEVVFPMRETLRCIRSSSNGIVATNGRYRRLRLLFRCNKADLNATFWSSIVATAWK